MCVLTAPEVFDQDDDGIVMLLVAEPSREQREVIETAVRLCPSGALWLEPDSTRDRQ